MPTRVSMLPEEEKAISKSLHIWNAPYGLCVLHCVDLKFGLLLAFDVLKEAVWAPEIKACSVATYNYYR